MVSTAIKSTSIVADGDVPLDGGSSAPAQPPDTDASASSGVASVSTSAATIMAQADTSLIRLDQFRAEPRFAGIDGRGVSVVVIDTGIDLNHSFFGPDANGNSVADRIVFSYDFSGGNDSNASDTVGHGSNVASIIGSQDGTYTGMAPGVNIIALKVFPDGSNSASDFDIAEALNWVVNNRAAYNIVAVNMSLGYGDNQNVPTSSAYSSQFATLAANNTAVVVSSGNSYAAYQTPGVSSPSSDPNAWSIGAVWDRNLGFGLAWQGGATDYTTGPDRIISFSQRSPTMTTVFAPGGQITGANYDGGLTTYSGTSQAAPHIAGLVADMQQLALQVSGHFLSVSQLKADLLASAATIFDGDDENDNVNNTFANYKRVDALAWGVQVLTDLFAGTAGNDALNGTSVADTIHGAGGNDRLSGNGGSDILTGDAGSDTLNGGAGNDSLSGGAGGDAFVFAPGLGADTVVDFSHAEGDRLDVSALLNIHGLGDILSRTVQSGVNTLIDFSGGNTITLNNVAKSTLVAGDFSFNTLVEAAGSTGVDIVGNTYWMYALSAMNGVQLGYQGSAFTVGQLGAWTVLGAEQVGGGYQVALKNGAVDQYTIWNTNSAGMYQSSSAVVFGSDPTVMELETSFQQDLNGDGRLGFAVETIESAGATSAVKVGSNFFFYPVGGSSGPRLSYGGAPVTVNQFGAWTMLGAEQVGGGYQVAWKNGTADQYAVWTTNASGAYQSSTANMAGSDAALKSQETVFQQDLNGDGQIGSGSSSPPSSPTVIESAGATSAVKVGNNFFFYPVGGSSGPALSYGGAPVTLTQFGTWTMLGAEQVGSGYQVAWKNGSADQYAIWTTNASGAFQSSTANMAGGDAGLQSQETVFQQDLNGDGRIGLPPPSSPVVIEAAGGTDFVQVGNNYFLYPHLASSGPELSYGGAPVTVGQFGAWTPLGVEKTSSVDGQYNVAWKSGNQFKFWVTDSSGNYLGETTAVSGSDAEMPGRENFFHQDLNGDGHVGTLSAEEPTSPFVSGVGLATTASLTLLTNYMMSFDAPAAASPTAAEPQPPSLQDYLSRPLA